MKRSLFAAVILAGTALVGLPPAVAGQAPYSAGAPNIPISAHDRVYTGDQFSNTVSVVDPIDQHARGRHSARLPIARQLQPAL